MPYLITRFATLQQGHRLRNDEDRQIGRLPDRRQHHCAAGGQRTGLDQGGLEQGDARHRSSRRSRRGGGHRRRTPVDGQGKRLFFEHTISGDVGHSISRRGFTCVRFCSISSPLFISLCIRKLLAPIRFLTLNNPFCLSIVSLIGTRANPLILLCDMVVCVCACVRKQWKKTAKENAPAVSGFVGGFLLGLSMS